MGTMSLTVSRSRTALNSITLLFFFYAAISALASHRDQDASIQRSNRQEATIELDAERIIRAYSSPQAIAEMPQWKQLIISVDQRTRAAILTNLPSSYRKYENNNKTLHAKLSAIIDRALDGYNKRYSLFILTHPQPSIMHENYTVLVITTGLLERIPDDAALLMFLFHETAHDFFAEESIRSKDALNQLVVDKKANGPEAQQLVRQLILIELKCDAVATRLAIAAGQDTASFSNVLLKIYKDYPDQLTSASYIGFNIHPSPQLRAHVIQSITAGQAPPKRSIKSPELKEINRILSTERLIDSVLTNPSN